MLLIAFLILTILFQQFSFFIKTNILQNQYYSLKRYILFYKNKLSIVIIKSLSLIVIIILSFITKYIILLFPLLFIGKFSNKIIKFHCSNRVKRQLIIFEIINLSNVLFILLKKESPLFFLLIIIYNLVLYWFSFWLSYIIEKIIQRHYIKLAKEKLKKYNVTFIAITGSYGKTSCKNYTYEFLKDTYNVLQTPKSYNTLNGLLKTINEQLKPYHEIFIAEIGVDQKNGMNKYLKNFIIDIGVVTKIGNQHIKTFKNIENIKNEKTKILKAAKQYAIINLNDSLIDYSTIQCNKIFVSTNNDNKLPDISIQTIEEEIDKTSIRINILGKSYETYTKLLGKHNLENLSCAIGVAKSLNVKDEIIIEKVKHLENPLHRLSIIKQDNWTIIDDSYNSNYIGFINALDVLKKSKDKKVIITPGLIEQIKNETQDQNIANKILECCDLVILIKDPTFQNKIPNKLVFSEFIDAYNYLKYNYKEEKLCILIENDLPDIFLK